MRIYKTHRIFTKADFTVDEYERKNILAVQVIDFGLKTCSVCGRTESDLNRACKSGRKNYIESVLYCYKKKKRLNKKKGSRKLYCYMVNTLL